MTRKYQNYVVHRNGSNVPILIESDISMETILGSRADWQAQLQREPPVFTKVTNIGAFVEADFCLELSNWGFRFSMNPKKSISGSTSDVLCGMVAYVMMRELPSRYWDMTRNIGEKEDRSYTFVIGDSATCVHVPKYLCRNISERFCMACEEFIRDDTMYRNGIKVLCEVQHMISKCSENRQ
jgi:hypothetical protein